MDITGTVNRIDELKAEIDKSLEQHQKIKSSNEKEIAALSSALELTAGGVDYDRITNGKQVIKVRGKVSDSGKRSSLVQLAISDIAKGCPEMRESYFGIKVYSGFGEQREDHRYGYGPRHGSIVFSVGLASHTSALTEDQANDAIYYLLNLERVQSAEEAAAA